jgi:hypothetical protein
MADEKTPVFDWIAGDFATDLQCGVVTATGRDAVEQIVLKATQTIRGLYAIYANLEDPQLDHKYGNDAQWTLIKQMPEVARISELKRNIYEALVYDPWITDVTDLEIIQDKAPDTGELAYFCSCTVIHIYGTTNIEGVDITNG